VIADRAINDGRGRRRNCVGIILRSRPAPAVATSMERPVRLSTGVYGCKLREPRHRSTPSSAPPLGTGTSWHVSPRGREVVVPRVAASVPVSTVAREAGVSRQIVYSGAAGLWPPHRTVYGIARQCRRTRRSGWRGAEVGSGRPWPRMPPGAPWPTARQRTAKLNASSARC
jgi:hypothetical protein